MTGETIEVRNRRLAELLGPVHNAALHERRQTASENRANYIVRLIHERELTLEAKNTLAAMGYVSGSRIDLLDESGKERIKGTLGKFNPNAGTFGLKKSSHGPTISAVRLLNLSQGQGQKKL